jgi:hypothetical protein
VRPVAEGTFLRELDTGTSASGLVGAIFEPRSDLAFDLGVRLGREQEDGIRELRAGLTWSFRAGGGP